MRLPLEPGLFICVLSVCIKVFKLMLKNMCFLDEMEPKFCADSLRCVNLRFQKSFLHLLCVCQSVGCVTLLLKLTNLFVCLLFDLTWTEAHLWLWKRYFVLGV